MRGGRGLPTLQCTSIRSIALRLFQAQVRWRRLSDLKRGLPENIQELGLPLHLRHTLVCLKECAEWRGTLYYITRNYIVDLEYAEKHSQLFEGDAKPTMKERAPRFEHLRTYYYCLTWRSNRYEINDVVTAQKIIKELDNWRQMKFQFACAYAMQNLIGDDFTFDRHYRTAFKTRLAHHPVYDFWLTLLETSKKETMFLMENQAPNQKVMLCFRFAVTHGFIELTKYFWDKITLRHRESMCMLQWRALLFRTRSRETLRFLSMELVKINPHALTRLTWTIFYDALYKCLTGTETEKIVEERKVRFLLDNISRVLKTKLLKTEKYKAIIDAYYYKHERMFAYLLENVPDSLVRAVRERVDRIIDRRKTVETNLHRTLIRRQVTIDEASLRS